MAKSKIVRKKKSDEFVLMVCGNVPNCSVLRKALKTIARPDTVVVAMSTVQFDTSVVSLLRAEGVRVLYSPPNFERDTQLNAVYFRNEWMLRLARPSLLLAVHRPSKGGEMDKFTTFTIRQAKRLKITFKEIAV